jgi:hypothetical protein
MIKVALIVMVLFFLLFGGLGFYYMSQVGSEQKEGSLEKELAEQKAQREQLLEDIAKLAADVEVQEDLLAERKEQKEAVTDHVKRLRVARDSFKNHAEIRQSHSENIQATERRVSSALDGGGEENAPTIQALRTKKEEFEEQYTKRRDELQNTSDDITKELTKQTLRYRRRYEEKRKLRDRLETEIVQIREELQRFMVRDLPEVDMGHDGIVLTVDIESRQAVINVGRRQGIKCGMRFEAFQLRQGSRRVRKGYLVVRSAGRETASCIIVDMAIRLPRCPGDGYTARYPEERFCPFCTGSAGGARVQRLSAIPKETNLGMDPENPIVAGDLIQNPLYESGRELHFAVKGDTESPLSEKWKTEDFIAAIKWHGGLVDADLTAQTDVLLAGKYAMDETRRARELGVRVLRQYEVFDFLRQ